MDTASVRRTQKKDREQGIDQQDIFYRMVLFLAALTCGLLSRVLGADDAPFGPVMGKRGTPAQRLVRRLRALVLPPAARPSWPCRPPRRLSAAPGPSGSGPGHRRRGPAALPAARA